MNDQEEIRNAAAYYIIVCSEFLKKYGNEIEDEPNLSNRRIYRMNRVGTV